MSTGNRMQSNNQSAARRRGRVLVIGLDGATFDLIKPWAAAGHLPTLRRLLEEGAHGELQSTIPPMTGPAWTTFATGVNPGKHDLYDWIARTPGTYQFRPTTALDCKTPSIYELLSRVQRRVCVLNVPMTFPPQPVNGVMIGGLPAPSVDSGISYPPAALEAAIDKYLSLCRLAAAGLPVPCLSLSETRTGWRRFVEDSDQRPSIQ